MIGKLKSLSITKQLWTLPSTLKRLTLLLLNYRKRITSINVKTSQFVIFAIVIVVVLAGMVSGATSTQQVLQTFVNTIRSLLSGF